MNRDKLKQYGKVAGTGVVGAALGVAGAAGTGALDDNATNQQVQNLQDKVDNLNQQVDQLDDRPTQQTVEQLRATIQEKNEKIDSLFTQEEVNQMVADATERTTLTEYLPAIASGDVELDSVGVAHDQVTGEDTLTVHVSDSGDGDGVKPERDVTGDYEGEEYDAVHATYTHDEGHVYHADVVTFEDSADADEYQEELKRVVANRDFDEDDDKDAYVYRNGDTVVYLYGSEAEDEAGYNFDQIVAQYN